MRVLFISTLSKEGMFGGDVCSKRNFDSIQSILGGDNVVLYSLSSKSGNGNNLRQILVRLIEVFYGYMLGLNNKKIKEIYSIIEHENISIVFLDSSLMGGLAKNIKKSHPSIKIITFFHNTEVKFLWEFVKINRKISRFFWVILAFYNERTCCKYSDHLIALNMRDTNMIYNLYKVKIDSIIPISLNEQLPKNTRIENLENIKKTALFVGSYFYANYQGINWFVDNVMPKVTIKLIIVGKNMDHLRIKKSWAKYDIEIHSSVQDLSIYYSMADFVIMPLFSGSGMKVKTAEALMYGKYILGTNEAFEGYEINNQVGEHCNNAIEFIDAINKYDGKNKFSSFSKKLFDEKYSFETTLISFKEVIGNL